jgi:hypothetical protein
MTILHEPNGYVGGYLVTNVWGRPLEFRLSTAVQPNRIQQILYGQALEPYIYADLIGKALIDRASTQVQLILTDRAPVLELRPRIEVPVVYISAMKESSPSEQGSNAVRILAASNGMPPAFCHSRFGGDQEIVSTLLNRLCECIELAEPFDRVREAVCEARKMGASIRA